MNKITSRILFSILVGMVAGCGAIPRAQFCVSPDGRDTNVGTPAEPFATLACAQQAVRRLVNAGLTEDVVVLVRGGTYVLDEPWVFTPEDGGTARHAVIYGAWPGEEVVISGGRVIEELEPAGEGRWGVDIPDVAAGKWWFRQLFVDGQRKPRARFPNAPELLRVKAVSPDVTEISFEQPLIGGDLTGHGSELVVLENWSVTRGAIQSSSEAAVTTKTPMGWIGHAWTTAGPGKPAYLEHAPAFLDVAGEWHLDRATGRLTYQAAPGEDPRGRRFIAPVAERLLVIEGDRQTPVRNLHFRGLTFAHTRWHLPEFGYSGIQAGHYGPAMKEHTHVLPAAIEWAHAEDGGLERCRVVHTGAGGIAFGPGCRRNRIVGCEIADVGGNGIMIGRRRDPELAGQPGDPSLAADWKDPADVPEANEVTNCFVHHCGRVNHGCVGIYDAFCKNTRIAHNLVADLPYTGISVGFRWDESSTSQTGCVIESNHVRDVMQMLADGGAIYTLGLQPGTVLRRNLLHGVRRSAFAHGGAPNNGVFFDQGSKGFLIEENMIHDTAGEPVRFNQCKRESFTWKGNQLGVPPTDPGFDQEITGQAGLEPAYQSLVTERLTVADPTAQSSKARRFGSVVGLRKDKLEEYKRLHAKVWPGVLDMIRKCNIRNYSIYLTEIGPGEYHLFSYFEYVGDDFEKDMARMGTDPTTRRWWTYTDPCQIPVEVAGEGELWHEMEEVFHSE